MGYGKGRIWFDGNNGVIASNSWFKNNDMILFTEEEFQSNNLIGMKIDLDNAQFYAGNDNNSYLKYSNGILDIARANILDSLYFYP